MNIILEEYNSAHNIIIFYLEIIIFYLGCCIKGRSRRISSFPLPLQEIHGPKFILQFINILLYPYIHQVTSISLRTLKSSDNGQHDARVIKK